MNDQRRELRTLVRGAYDVQKLRIEMGNRIAGNFKAKLGQEPGKSEDTLEDDAKAVLASLRGAYKKLTDGLKRFPTAKGFEGDEVISSYTELVLIDQYIALEKRETEHFARLKGVLTEFAIWREFLEGVRGIGPAMAGVIISEFDIHRAKYPSSLWAYSGYDVARDGGGRSRRKEHLVEREYTDKNGKPATRVGLSFNPFLKTKLRVLAELFIKMRTEPYRKLYDDYKHRMESHAQFGVANDGVLIEGKMITSKGRRHAMAMRYMIKRFLIDLYNAWRPIEGLEVAPPYHEAKLKMRHTG